MIEAAVQGCGLAYVWEDRAAPHLRSGVLRRILDEWCAINDELFLYYSSRRYVSGALRALIDRVKAKGDQRCEEAPDGAAKARDRQSQSFVDRRKRLLISENASWFIQRQTSGTGAGLPLRVALVAVRNPPED